VVTAIGTTGGQRVFCHALLRTGNYGYRPQFERDGVALEANGNFRIDDLLTPPPPAPCTNPVLLNPERRERPTGSPPGIPKNDTDDQ